jgi:hypothetical protein
MRATQACFETAARWNLAFNEKTTEPFGTLSCAVQGAFFALLLQILGGKFDPVFTTI